ncbi:MULTISPECIES: DNA recombination protein RmuC [unclassified Marinobacter]|uniref:DNA recombination protein RmuC n=1 Tax=unclassified Marinobacter TaxID=83889 RepID=UPI001906C82E|nr:DNA recombination protein RmuC [Marinobacter sp. 1-4A]MBK1852454.1 DNA recombination protein RmuC [Marinobacter sp. 1-4A]MCK0164867.1 DNA recombination protein RmuC [Marinobacter sp. S6332]
MPTAVSELMLSRPEMMAALVALLFVTTVVIVGLLVRAKSERRAAGLQSDVAAQSRRIEELLEERQNQQAKMDRLGGELGEARALLREQQAVLKEERRSATEKLALLERNRDALKQEFENLANRIFEQKSERFTQQTRTSLDTLLNPFRDQLQDFRKRVEDVYTTETRDRQALRSEIKSLQDLNRQITEEAANLTRALKGDKKVQGNWGELILERVLEKSGLRKGIEYDTQGSYRDTENQLLRPDVVVHLPDNRNLVIDSKVSLVAYQKWITEEDDSAREDALKTHVDAVRNHIRTLSEKDYSQLDGLHSPDFVFLFMPIEPAFVAAFQQDENLFSEAFERKIIVVTPTTLLATLRTVENIWRYERQSQNARLIAERAGAVYDKLRVFVEAMERLGGQLHTAQVTYDSAMNTLTRGRGNLISQANRFVELGVRVKRELPKAIVDQAEVDSEPELTREEADSETQAIGADNDQE